MNKRIRKIVTLLLTANILVFVSFGSCFAGAWTSKKGKMYNRFAFNHYYAHEEFDEHGSRRDFESNGSFKDMNLSYYLEYGIFDELTLITSLYYKYLKYEDDNVKRERYGISDMDLGLKYKLLEGSRGVLSTQGLIKVPEAYDKDERLPLGNGQYDFELRLLYGLSLWPRVPGYCNFEAGYRFRAEEPADESRYLIEFGVDFTKKIYGRIKLDGILGMDNADETTDASGNPSATNNFDLGKLDITFGYKIAPKWALETGYTHAIYGKNTSSGATYTLALTFQTL